MKEFLICILFFIISTSNLAHAQAVVENVVKAVNNSDASLMSKAFSSSIDINIDNNQAIYSKTQAEVVIKKFFEANTIKSFETKYISQQDDRSFLYIVGTLITEKSNYLVLLNFKHTNNTYYLVEIKFEPQS